MNHKERYELAFQIQCQAARLQGAIVAVCDLYPDNLGIHREYLLDCVKELNEGLAKLIQEV